MRMRERMARNFLATLAFSQGVPMVSHGDELGRTQGGNNNPYCQDNEITWVDWNLDAARKRLLAFAQLVFRIRRENPVLRRNTFFGGHPVTAAGVKDLTWLRPDGREMTESDWASPRVSTLGMLLHGTATDERDTRGRPVVGETLLLLLDGGGRSKRFVLPRPPEPGRWVEAVNTAEPGARTIIGDAVNLVAHSLMLLRYEKAC